MNYYNQLNKVVVYIGQHLDDEISLDSLSSISCLSKFHFHRLFTVFTGMSLQQYIKWLRLKRAAHQLIFDKEESILNIAINAGFESHEAFTRAFKKACGYSPNQFRRGINWAYWEKLPYCLPKQGENEMKAEIRQVNKIRLAVVEHRGDPQLMAEAVNKLISWAKAQTIDLKPRPGEAFGIAYDDPKITAPADFKFDLGLKVPANLKLEGDVVEKFLPAGRYAVALHKGSHDHIGETIYALYRDWVPEANEQLGDFPCVFCYHNFANEVAETELLTECWLLLK